jgi:hypothetical protein
VSEPALVSRTPGESPIPLHDGERHLVGAGQDAHVRVAATGIAPIAALERRDSAWWLVPLADKPLLNGVTVAEPARLRDGDQLEFSAGTQFEFVSGERRTRRMASAADMRARPRPGHGPLPRPPRQRSSAAMVTVAAAVLLLAGAGGVLWYAVFRAAHTIDVLSDRQATELDSLLIVADDHVERGGTLLELGLADGASQEFARAVNTLALSDLRNRPEVAPRIASLAASVAQVYRERSLAVPDNYARATAPLSPEQLRTASLSVDEFAGSFALLAATFEAHFGHAIVVSGRDHPEHVALYGKGGAMDLSIKTMTPAEVSFVIDQAHQHHIRIKDFSRDSVLRREVQAAVSAGLLFEAGTGLHLHIDRFANRRDKWTTLAPFRRRDDGVTSAGT